jgi:hypothetical protein
MRALLTFWFLICVNIETAGAAKILLKPMPDSLVIQIDDMDVAHYVYRDAKISRPYFAHVKTISGIQMTRNHPPKPGEDATDHEGLHPGIWLSFGDLSGHDYWRLKARTEHVHFVSAPKAETQAATWSVLNRYWTTDKSMVVCDETCRYTIRLIPDGYMIESDSLFTPGPAGLVFGDQEEMGLGLRVASSLAVDQKKGGRILDNEARRNGSEVWGQAADWCDYSGPVNNRWVGVTLMSAPANFRKSWSHARDYGFVAINPFGRNAFTRGEKSRVEVSPGQSLKLRFAAVVHDSNSEADYDPRAAWSRFTD